MEGPLVGMGMVDMLESMGFGIPESFAAVLIMVLKLYISPPFSMKPYTEGFESAFEFHIKHCHSSCIINFNLVGVAQQFWSQICGMHIFGASGITEITA